MTVKSVSLLLVLSGAFAATPVTTGIVRNLESPPPAVSLLTGRVSGLSLLSPRAKEMKTAPMKLASAAWGLKPSQGPGPLGRPPVPASPLPSQAPLHSRWL